MNIYFANAVDANGENVDWFVRASSIQEAKKLLRKHYLDDDLLEAGDIFQLRTVAPAKRPRWRA